MSSIRSKLTLAALLALAALPGISHAQQAPAAPQAKPAMEEIQGWLTEIQQIHTRLEGIQQQALQDPQLSAAQTTLGSSIKAAMSKIDPALEQGMARMKTLEGEAATAQQAGDQAKLQQIAQEAQQIQEKFMAAQQKAVQQPELASQMQAFQSQLEKKMLEVDADAPKLIARFKELEQKLSAVMGQG